ncbi:MAG: hypothetical protein AAGB04_02240 [Pseudomonadota bacterium]
MSFRERERTARLKKTRQSTKVTADRFAVASTPSMASEQLQVDIVTLPEQAATLDQRIHRTRPLKAHRKFGRYMADLVRTLFNRLTADAIVRLFACVGLPSPDLPDEKRVVRTRLAIEALASASNEQRGAIEGMAGHIIGLSDRNDHVEPALRAACSQWPKLLDLLEQDLSVEERTLDVWLRMPSILDRARNLASAYRWRQGTRYHSAFAVASPEKVVVDLHPAMQEIQNVVQSIEGGRKAQLASFECYDPWATGVEADRVKHHITIYL